MKVADSTSKSYEGKLVQKLRSAITKFAKRQRTWFRRMERRGTRITWLSGAAPLDENVARMVQE